MRFRRTRSHEKQRWYTEPRPFHRSGAEGLTACPEQRAGIAGRAQCLTMIVLSNVSKTYATGKQALLGVTLTVPRDDFIFLVGPNGAGKSTLLKLLIRAEVASSGAVIVAGHDLNLLPERRVAAFRQQIGIVFQDIRLFPEKTVFENVAFSLQVSDAPRRGKTSDLVMEALDLVGLAAHARRFPNQLSGGEQQRTAIA